MIGKGKANKNRYLKTIGIIDGLTEKYKLNYVYYDLKVCNILNEESNCEGEKYIRTVISDFGRAKLKERKLEDYNPGFCWIWWW